MADDTVEPTEPPITEATRRKHGRTPEQKAKRAAQQRAYYARLTPEQKARMAARKRARLASRSEEEKKAASARVRAWVTANKEKRDRWRAENRGKLQAATAGWRELNKERHRAAIAAWNAANKERKAAWNAANQDRIRSRAAERRAQNPERFRAVVRKRRATVLGVEGSHTASDIKRLFSAQRWRCAYCRCSLKAGYEVDHIVPLASGGTNWPSNLQLTCATCNRRKGDVDPIDFANRLGRLI